jgi:uncharacterized protein involved in exopolysaccharide biosynthesis
VTSRRQPLAALAREVTVTPRDLQAMMIAGGWISVAVVVLSVAFVLVVLLSIPKTYNSIAVVEIGRVHHDLLEHSSKLVQYVQARNIANILVKERKLGVIEIHALGDSPQQSRDALRRVLSDIISRHNAIYHASMQPYLVLQSDLESQARVLEDRLAELSTTQVEAGAAIRPLVSDITMTMSKLRNEIESGLKMTPTRVTYPTQDVDKLPLPKRVTRPRTAHYLFGIGLGVMLGLCIAFLVGYIRWLRQQAEN